VETNEFNKFIIYVSKGEKFFILSDSLGYFTILRKDGSFRSRFSSGAKQIKSINRFSLNVIYTTPHKVGFLRFLEATPGSITCDAGK
jgi:hypothetical protein